MTRAATFESYWPLVSSAGLDAIPVGLPAGLAELLGTAHEIQEEGMAVPVPDLGSEWDYLLAEIDAGAPSMVVELAARRRRPVGRALLATAAVFALLVAVSLHAHPDSPLYGLRRGAERAALALSPTDTSLHLRMAGARLDDLLVALSLGQYQRAPAIADALEVQRSAAMAEGADVRTLNARIASDLPPMLSGAPSNIAAIVNDCLKDTVSDEEADEGIGINPDADEDYTPVGSGQSTGSPGQPGVGNSGSTQTNSGYGDEDEGSD